MNNEIDMVETLKVRRSEKRKKVAEATGRILMDLNGAYVECREKDPSFDEINKVVIQVIEQIKASENKVIKRTAG